MPSLFQALETHCWIRFHLRQWGHNNKYTEELNSSRDKGCEGSMIREYNRKLLVKGWKEESLPNFSHSLSSPISLIYHQWLLHLWCKKKAISWPISWPIVIIFLFTETIFSSLFPLSILYFMEYMLLLPCVNFFPQVKKEWWGWWGFQATLVPQGLLGTQAPQDRRVSDGVSSSN